MTPPPESSLPDDYVDADRIADELGVHLQTAQRYFRDGGLPGRKLGKRWVTTRAAFNAWLTGTDGAIPQPADLTDDTALPPLETKDQPS